MSENNKRGRPALPKEDKHKSISICITIPLEICKELSTIEDVERMKMCGRGGAVEAMQAQIEKINRQKSSRTL